MAHLTINFLTDALRRPVTIEAILPTDKMAVQGFHLPEKKPMKSLYVLEGLMSNQTGAVHYTNIQGLAEDNNCAVFIVGGENQWYANATVGWANYNDLVWNDLVKFTRASFNLSDKREDTFIAGFSMGGGGALVIGLSHPEIFGRILNFSSSPCEYDSTNPGMQFKDVYHIEGCDTYEELAKQCAARTDVEKPLIFMTSGSNDVCLSWDEAFCKTLADCGFDVTWKLHEGLYHSWHTYQMGIEEGFEWLPLDRFDKEVCCIGPDASVEKIFAGWTPYFNAEADKAIGLDINEKVNEQLK